MEPDPREAALARVRTFCDTRLPPRLRGEMRLEAARRGNSITIVERRPAWPPGTEAEWTRMRVAQLRHDPATGLWSLHCADRNGRWWPYHELAPSRSIDPLLAEIDADPTGIFWG